MKKQSDIKFYGQRGPYAFLSNFYPSPITLDGKEWLTVEHRYQAMKTTDMDLQEDIRQGLPLGETTWRAQNRGVTRDCKVDLSPGASKKKGQRVPKRKDWDSTKELFMYEALKEKFSIPELRQKLLDTGTAQLYEDSPSDAYWGTAQIDCNKGQNRLGVLLMLLRDDLVNRLETKEAFYVPPKRMLTLVLEIHDMERAKTIWQRYIDGAHLKGCEIKKVMDGDIPQAYDDLRSGL